MEKYLVGENLYATVDIVTGFEMGGVVFSEDPHYLVQVFHSKSAYNDHKLLWMPLKDFDGKLQDMNKITLDSVLADDTDTAATLEHWIKSLVPGRTIINEKVEEIKEA